MQKNQGDLYRYPVDGLSRRRQGFKSPWGRQVIPIGYAPVAFKLPGTVYWLS